MCISLLDDDPIVAQLDERDKQIESTKVDYEFDSRLLPASCGENGYLLIVILFTFLLSPLHYFVLLLLLLLLLLRIYHHHWPLRISSHSCNLFFINEYEVAVGNLGNLHFLTGARSRLLHKWITDTKAPHLQLILMYILSTGLRNANEVSPQPWIECNHMSPLPATSLLHTFLCFVMTAFMRRWKVNKKCILQTQVYLNYTLTNSKDYETRGFNPALEASFPRALNGGKKPWGKSQY